jgi:PAS domain S-box-containing protein
MHKSDENIEELRNTRDYLNAIVSGSLDSIAVFNEQQFIEYVNDAACQFIGMDREQVIGQHLSAFVPPELQEFYQQKWEQMMAVGVEPYEGEILKPDGSKVPVLISDRVVTVGGQKKCITVIKDISELKATQKALQRSNENLENLVEKRTAELSGTVAERDRVIEALRQSEADYRILVNYAGFIVIRCKLDGTMSFMNDMGRQYVGQRPEDVVGRHITEVWGRQAGGEFMGGIRGAIEKGKDIERELKMDTWPNGPRWLWSRYNIMRDAQGVPESIVFFAHDITTQKQAEIKLKESEANFRTFFESMTEMIIVGTQAGRILFTNPAVTRTLGYSAEELATMHVLDVHPSKDRREAEEIFAAMFRGEREICPLPMAHKDGGLVPVETRVWFGRWDGQDCIFGVSKNLTAEQEAQQRFERLFRHNPALVAVSALPDMRFDDVNDAFLKTLGYSRDEVIGRTSAELGLLVHPEQQAAAADKLLAEGHFAGFEFQVRRKDGAILDGLFSGEVISNQGRQYFLTVMIDITERKLAQQRAKESHERYQHLLETAGVSISCFDTELRITLINGIAAAYSGKRPDEMLGKRISDFLTPPHGRDIEDNLRNVMATNRISEREIELILPAGRRWFWAKASPLHDADGRTIGAMTFSHDITEGKLAQEKLKESEERYHQLMETAGIAVTCFDKELRITLINDVSAARYQKRPDEIVGKRISDILASPWCDSIEANIRKVLESGRVSEREVELVFPVGRRWFWSKASPLHDASAKVSGVIVFAHDITEQKLAQIALQESEHRRRMLSEIAIEGIFMHEDGVLLEANHRYFEMFGYRPEELLGRQARDITLTPESLRVVMENARPGGNKMIQVTGVRKDGSQFLCETYGMDAVYKGRNVRIAMAMDISDRIKAETELARIRERMAVAERLAAVGHMGVTMAHEINTPLSVMKLTAQMLISDIEKGKVAQVNKDQARTILAEIDHASEIVHRYREISRPAHDVNHNASDILSSLEGLMHLLKKTAERVKLKLLIGPQVPDLLVRLGSVDCVEQLLLILTENAIQAADGKTWRELKIVGSLKDGNIEIRFIDNCCGIPPENLQKIFEPFFSTKPRNVGTGLGLSIVRRLLQERGGRIQVESKVGEGTTFIVTYPVQRV